MSAIGNQRRTACSISELVRNFEVFADATLSRNLGNVRDIISGMRATRRNHSREYSRALSRFEFDHGAPGSRIVFRREGIRDQVVGRRALNEILLTRVTDEDIRRGSLQLRLKFRVNGRSVVFPVDFNLPKKGSDKQPVWNLYFAMDSALYQVPLAQVGRDSQIKFKRQFLERLACWATLSVADLTRFWSTVGPCSFELGDLPDPKFAEFPPQAHAYSFRGQNPWLVFLIWTQFLHGRVSACNARPECSMNRVPVRLLFDRDQLNRPGSPQAVILTAIKAVLGDHIFAGNGLQRPEHGQFTRFQHDDSYKLLSLHLHSRAQFLPLSAIMFLKLLASYFYNNNNDHSFMGQDEQFTYLAAGAYYLVGVYGSPEFVLYHGVWRLLLQFIRDAGIYEPLITRVRQGNNEVKYFPRDFISNPARPRVFPLGSIEPFFGTRLLTLMLTPDASIDRCTFFKLDQNVPALDQRASQGLRWPGHRDIEQQQQQYRSVPSLLGGFGRYRAIA